MGDLISRAAALDAIDNERKLLIEQERYGAEHVIVHNARRIIEELPTAPVKHARWKDNGNGTVSCSRCSTWFPKEREPYLLFCGYCGAKMDGDTNG